METLGDESAPSKNDQPLAPVTPPRATVFETGCRMGVRTRDLCPGMASDLPRGYGKDRLVALVRDTHWIFCYWELTPETIQRAEATLAQEWQTARLVLRLLDSSSAQEGPPRTVREIPLTTECGDWYIEVPGALRSWRMDLGYLGRDGNFLALASSETVTTPRIGISDVIDPHWTPADPEKAGRLFTLLGECLTLPSS